MNRTNRLALLTLAAAVAVGAYSLSSSHASPTTAPTTAPSGTRAAFGAPMKLTDDKAVPVETLLADPAKFDGKYVRITGTVNDVCPKKGCWLTLHDQKTNEDLFVKFPDPEEGRLIPMNATGKPAVIEGTVKVKEISESMARHYKEDKGAPREEIEKIKGPQKQVSITNGSAEVEGVQGPNTK